MSIKNILFDLDDTIYDFGMAEDIALGRMLTDIGVRPTEEKIKLYSRINLSYWKRLECGEITREQVKVERFRSFFSEIMVDYSPEKADVIYRSYLNQGHFFIDGAWDMLQKLHGKYRMYLVTNGTADTQKGRIASGKIEQFFDKIFVSELIGFNKPDKEFFDYCFQKIGNIKKDETIIIGDSLTSDIQGGIHAGIRTLWFNGRRESNATEIKPDYEVHKLCEISELLERI